MPLGQTIYAIAAITIAAAIYFIVLIITIKRNANKVVKVFEENKALSATTAISATKLNIKEPGVIERAIKKRDNRHHALKFLINGGAVIITHNNSYYLDKTRMAVFKEKSNFIVGMMIPNIDN